jgi:cytochrome o ubiquinol oxidase subunit 2
LFKEIIGKYSMHDMKAAPEGHTMPMPAGTDMKGMDMGGQSHAAGAEE